MDILIENRNASSRRILLESILFFRYFDDQVHYDRKEKASPLSEAIIHN